jgi:lysyl-tRNA synthetase class 2
MSSEVEQIAQRKAKLDELVALGVPPYPVRFDRADTISAVVAAHGDTTGEALEAAQPATRVAGRILSIRSFGKANFLVLSDGLQRLQVYVRADSMPALDFDIFKRLDFGDHVGVSGRVFRTKTNELTIWAASITFLAKCLLPLPEKWHGLTDVEVRYRQRYLDLIVNAESRQVFEVRARVVAGIRRFMNGRGFLEVETPMMQPIAGGALARPFVTHHNTLDMQLYLRIAPELYLKRLTVGGFEKVYEINRNFRNEGISTQHNPEFTMLEFYEAYVDYQHLMTMTEEMLAEVAQEAIGGVECQFNGHAISFAAPFRRLSLRHAAAEAASERLGRPVSELDLRDRSKAAEVAKALRFEVKPGHGAGKIATTIFEGLWEDQLVQPTFVFDFPTEVSPLSKQKPDDPDTVERFEMYAGGFEVANGFSELNDPAEQRRRFDDQLKRAPATPEGARSRDADRGRRGDRRPGELRARRPRRQPDPRGPARSEAEAVGSRSTREQAPLDETPRPSASAPCDTARRIRGCRRAAPVSGSPDYRDFRYSTRSSTSVSERSRVLP